MTPFLQGIAVALTYVGCIAFAVWVGCKLHKAQLRDEASKREAELIASTIQTKPEPLRLIQGGRK